MSRLHSFLLVLAVWPLAVHDAAAQAPPPRPYQPVAITLPGALEEKGFKEFRAKLAVAAKSRLYAELAALVIDEGFFWERDFGQRFDPHRPAVDNLATAIALEGGNGDGWQTLAAFAAEESAEPLGSRPGVVCAPANPSYDSVAYSQLLDTSATSVIDWAYPRADATPVRAEAQTSAATRGTLGLHFVRLLGFEGAAGEPYPGRAKWAHVALPDGRTGFAAPGSLLSLTQERLCYGKDLSGAWRIAGYIAGGN
jgi:hypothetical protein